MIETNASIDLVGAVVIGRNEGERLRICLESVLLQIHHVVYVDSGSSDNSIDVAKKLNVEVVRLDMFLPFTAARARNAGFNHLMAGESAIRYVQFIDGDCELDNAWVPAALSFLGQHEDVAVVCGRRRERFPEKSIYNLLCDIEWNSRIGEVRYCGGDTMIRTLSMSQVGGFRDDMIAGEEPELCVRLRMAGWKIFRLKSEMTLHDANMTRFYQWWMRAIRSGYAYAQGMAMHGRAPEFQNIRECLRIWFWGAALPIAAYLTFLQLGFAALLILTLYPLQVMRMTISGRETPKVNLYYACFVMLGKFPELGGMLKFYWNRAMRVNARLIEYK